MFSIRPELLKIYRDYTYERASIYHKKEVLKLAKPWSDDPFLTTYKFTNIRRELDRQSVYLIDTVCENYSLSKADKALNCALFRMINHKEGTQYLPNWPVKFDEFDIDESLAHERALEASKTGGALQSNAYFLSHMRKISYAIYPEHKGNTALAAYVLKNADIIVAAFNAKSAKESYEILTQVSGFGPFMAYQIFVDFTYCDEYEFYENEFVISGPGCDNGIDWILGAEVGLDDKNEKYVKYGTLKELHPDKTYEDFLWWFEDNLYKLMLDANLDWNPKDFQSFLPSDQRDWNVMQIENSFCEYNKLMKLRNNIRMRARYYNGLDK